MRKFIFIVIPIVALMLFLASLIFPVASPTAVTVTLLTPSQAAVTKDAFVRFELSNYGTNVPRVVGSNTILPSYIDAYPDNTGTVNVNIMGNDQISPSNTYYHVCYYKHGVKYYCCDVTISGASFDMDSASCMQAAPPSPMPFSQCVQCAPPVVSACGTTGDVAAGTVCAGPPILNGPLSSTYIQSNFGYVPCNGITCNGSSIPIPLSSPVVQGNNIIVWTKLIGNALIPSGTFNVHDSLGNTFSIASAGANAQLYKTTSYNSGTDTITCGENDGAGGGSYQEFVCVAIEATNLGTFDIHASGSGPHALVTTDSDTTVSLATTGTNDIVFAFNAAGQIDGALNLFYDSGNLNTRQSILNIPMGTLVGGLMYGDGSTSTPGTYNYTWHSTGHWPNVSGSNTLDLYSFIPNTGPWPVSGAAYFRALQANDLSAFGAAFWNMAVTQFSTTPIFDFQQVSARKITLTNNVASSSFQNCKAGQIVGLDIIEDSTGGWTFPAPANVHGFGTVNTTANYHNRQLFYCSGSAQGTTAWALSNMQSGL